MTKNILQWAILVILAITVFAACNDTNANDTSSGTASTTANTPAAKPAEPAAATTTPASEAPAEQMAEPAADTPGVDSAAAEAIYAKNNCAMCHGKSLEGGKLGPALTSLASHSWDSAKLQVYLANPSDHSVNEERLSKLAEEYSMSMPAFKGSEEERKQLAEWLLTK